MLFDCDRVWFLTWTLYGRWLPGDPRGFVGTVRERRPGDRNGPRERHNQLQTEYDRAMPGLRRSARQSMTEPPARLNSALASVLRTQFAETAEVRDWRLFAGAIMADHVHLLVGVCGDPDPSMLMRDFKSYGSRALNRLHRRRWWTQSGSTRKKSDRRAVLAAARYTRDQRDALEVRLDGEIALALAKFDS
ncbi:hypothetical protein LzC2_21060 [Planctomycetes bacterium LzC2]|uniref:Transposase IS200-like domain-containing protein n=2 Tax=Alienimonas chondri TaxID=2681879 RepID=A0ABX1VFI4_9PLAN|nr:hypothetical protein [Alienimonas chondri]